LVNGGEERGDVRSEGVGVERVIRVDITKGDENSDTEMVPDLSSSSSLKAATI